MSDQTSNESPPSTRTKSIWDNPQSNWKQQLPDQPSFCDPNVTAEELRASIGSDARIRDFATPITAEALTYRFG